MASLQCYRQTNESYECQQKCNKPAAGYNHGSSMGQNVTGMTSLLHGSGGGHAYGTHGHQPNTIGYSTTTQCYSQNGAYNTTGHQGLGAPNHHGHQTGAYNTSGYQGLGAPDHHGHQAGVNCNTSGQHGSGASNHHGHVGSTTNGHGLVASCHGKTKKTRGDHHRKERDGRNLFQKIKDGISGDSTCSDSSDSDSDSDHEGGRSRRNRC